MPVKKAFIVFLADYADCHKKQNPDLTNIPLNRDGLNWLMAQFRVDIYMGYIQRIVQVPEIIVVGFRAEHASMQ